MPLLPTTAVVSDMSCSTARYGRQIILHIRLTLKIPGRISACRLRTQIVVDMVAIEARLARSKLPEDVETVGLQLTNALR